MTIIFYMFFCFYMLQTVLQNIKDDYIILIICVRFYPLVYYIPTHCIYIEVYKRHYMTHSSIFSKVYVTCRYDMDVSFHYHTEITKEDPSCIFQIYMNRERVYMDIHLHYIVVRAVKEYNSKM